MPETAIITKENKEKVEKFKYVEQEVPQEYALVITFSYDGQEDIELYSKVKDNVKVRTRQTERERERGRLR